MEEDHRMRDKLQKDRLDSLFGLSLVLSEHLLIDKHRVLGYSVHYLGCCHCGWETGCAASDKDFGCEYNLETYSTKHL